MNALSQELTETQIEIQTGILAGSTMTTEVVQTAIEDRVPTTGVLPTIRAGAVLEVQTALREAGKL